MRVGAFAAAGLALALVGCSADYVEEDQSTVLLVVQSINEGSPIPSDVRGGSGEIVNCQTNIAMMSLMKNPNNPGTALETVLLQRYDVSFTRSDGRAVEGLDVPYRFSAPMATALDPGDELTVNIDLVRQQAKLEPPLSNITGLQIVEMTANVTVFGQTISRKNVSASGAAAIRFADYADGTPSCESESGGGGN